MYVLILDGQIAGTTDYPGGYPDNFSVRPAPDGFSSDWYYDPTDDNLKPIPPKPEGGEGFTWQWSVNQWVRQDIYIPPISVITLPDGDVSETELLSHPLYQAVMEMCKTDQTLLTMVLGCVITFLFNREDAKTLLSQVVVYYEQHRTA